MVKTDSKRLAIFGAGKLGRMAFQRFLRDDVVCFVDNDDTKIGSKYCGKSVISFDEYLDLDEDIVTVVAMVEHASVVQQIKESTRNGKALIYDPQSEFAYRMIDNRIDRITGKTVAVLGLDDATTDSVIQYLYFREVDKLYVAEKTGNPKVGDTVCDHIVMDYGLIDHLIDSIVISPGLRGPIYEYYCMGMNAFVKVINPTSHRRSYETSELIDNPYIFSTEWGEIGVEPNEETYIEKSRISFDKEGYTNECVTEMEMAEPLFTHVEIETINRCNLNCSFCPIGKSRDTREKAIMSDELFEIIVDQLKDMDYSGRISTYSNNEPFLDERIIRFNKYIRNNLPDAHVSLYTNGTLLSLEKFKGIIDYIDDLVIDNYSNDLKMHLRSKEIYDYCNDSDELREKVTIVLRRSNDVLTSRGGDAPNRKKSVLWPTAKCMLPYFQLIIRPTGELSACCADPLGKRTLGDLRKQTILEAWYGEEYRKFRRELANGREKVDGCRYCDTFVFW